MMKVDVEMYRNYDGELSHIRLTLNTESANENAYEIGYTFTVNEWPYEVVNRVDLNALTILILERLG